MTFDSLVSIALDGTVMLPLLCSVLAGGLIGAERETMGKPAGLRTHTLVCFASALMTLLGLRMAEWSAALPEGTQIVSDMARMPHAILTGVGFLGAGVIFRAGLAVHGLTTAASLWLTASLGIVFGAGLLELATIATGIALGVLILLRALSRLAPPQPVARMAVAVDADSRFDGARLRTMLTDHRLRAGPLGITLDQAGGLRRYTLLAFSYDSRVDVERLARALQDEPAVRETSITPVDDAAA